MLFIMLVMRNVVYFMRNIVYFINYFRQFVSIFSDVITSHRILLHCGYVFETSIFFQFYIPFDCTCCIYFAPMLLFFHALIFMSYTSLWLMLSVSNMLNEVYFILSYTCASEGLAYIITKPCKIRNTVYSKYVLWIIALLFFFMIGGPCSWCIWYDLQFMHTCIIDTFQMRFIVHAMCNG